MPIMNIHQGSLFFLGYPQVFSISCIALFVACAISYYRTAHKVGLYRLPGPRLARYSNLWRLQNGASRQAPRNFQSLHKTYGKIVRIRPKHVSISDPAMIPVIYGVSSKFVKSAFYDTLAPLHDGKALHSIFSTQSQEHHRALKSGIAKKYSLSSLLHLEPLMDEVTENFIEKMRTFSNPPTDTSQAKTVDIGEWLQFYAFDVIGAITFSKTFGFLDIGFDYNGIIEGIDAGLLYASVIGQIPAFHPWLFGSLGLQKIMSYIPGAAKKNPIPTVLKMIKDALTTVDSTPKEKSHQDFLTFLREQNEKAGSTMSQRDMTNHMFVNLSVGLGKTIKNYSDYSNRLAGSDTTAISLRSIFYFLMKNPRSLSKLQAEIDTADQDGLLSHTITYAEAQKHVPYLAHVIKEALRLHPAVALTLERIVPQGGLSVDGEYLPAGTTVGINAWVVHYDEEVFGHDVHEFRPERWDNNDPAKAEQLMRMERSCFASPYFAAMFEGDFKEGKEQSVTLAKNVKFITKKNTIYFPIPSKETETTSALKGVEALVATALANLKYGKSSRKIEINLEQTTCSLFQTDLSTINGLGKYDAGIKAELKGDP
ncbi:hypothetical protein V498_01765 [Pseudogymnoascus sp. VKM F-4517 (FW-2822)]|nr:hypothetical protein V498_01765 [Pseudogymnoascus sp. VKM F-4517 (FW-2822)]